MLYNLSVVSARKTPSPSEWLVYRVGGREATHLGTVKAATMESAIAAAAQEYGVPAARIVVQEVSHA
jgi:membrane-bound lytic murein transglycosylase B